MYPSGELSSLAARKALLRVRIAERRWQCIEHGARLARPLAFVDRGLAAWRNVPPVAKAVGIPLIAYLGRRQLAKAGRLAALVKLAPLALRAARLVASRKT